MADAQGNSEALLRKLIYSSRAREVLGTSDTQRRQDRGYKRYLLAAAAILVLILGIISLMQPASVDRQLLAEEVYTFPRYAASRGGETSDLLAQYATRLNSSDRAGLAEVFADSASTIEEMYYLSHLLYADSQLASAEAVVDSVLWPTPYLSDEQRWLRFLIAFRNGDSASKLRTRAALLADRYQAAALDLIEGLE